jgi:hypothetical protein
MLLAWLTLGVVGGVWFASDCAGGDGASPFADGRSRPDGEEDWQLPDRDAESGERIHELDVLVVRAQPLGTLELSEPEQKQRLAFWQTVGAWREQEAFRGELGKWLNPFTLPLVGVGAAKLAQGYALDARLEKRLRLMEEIEEIRRDQGRGMPVAWEQDRFELMRLKREAVSVFQDGRAE